MKEKVFLFDFDGVIADSFVDACRRILPVFSEYGHEVSAEQLRVMFKGNINEEISKIIGEEHFQEFSAKTYIDFDLRKIDLFPGIQELLNELETLGHVVIITSNKTGIVRSILKEHGVLPGVEILGYDIEPSKTRKINMMKDKYGDAMYFYIGDTVGDIKEAEEAGVVSIAVTYGYHKREWLEEANPNYIVDSIKELKEFLLADTDLFIDDQ